MTIKQEIVNFVRDHVKTTGTPCTRNDIVKFYLSTYGRFCGNLSLALTRPSGSREGYLLSGPTDHLVKIGRNQYVAC